MSVKIHELYALLSDSLTTMPGPSGLRTYNVSISFFFRSSNGSDLKLHNGSATSQGTAVSTVHVKSEMLKFLAHTTQLLKFDQQAFCTVGDSHWLTC